MTTGEEPFPFSDLTLARRLEKTEALSNVDFVEARARTFPDRGAQWLEVGGAYAMYDDGSTSGHRFTTQRRAARIPHRLFPRQVASSLRRHSIHQNSKR